MSIDSVDEVHVRLREEIDRLGLSLAAASRAAGESGPQRLKDVVAGRQKCPVELLAGISTVGVDLIYVVTGERWDSNRATSHDLPADEQLVLDGYRALSAASKKQLLASLLLGEAGNGDGKAAAVSVTGSGNRTAGRDFHEKG